MHPLRSRIAAVGLALGLSVPPLQAAGAAPVDPVSEAQRLFQDGQAQYETLDYEGAIDTWMQAYVKFPDTEEFRATRGTVLYAIAQARLDLYETDKDTQHLVLARRILVAYRDKLDPADSGTRGSVQEWIDRIDAKLDEAGEGPPPDTEAAPTPASAPTDPDPATPEPAATTPRDQLDAAPTAEPRPGRGMVIGGAIMTALGVGLAAGGGTALGLAARDRSDEVEEIMNGGNPDDRTRDETRKLDDEGNALQAGQIAAFAVGGAMVAAGVALLVVGAKRNKAGSARASVVPALGPAFGGIVLEGRF